MSGRMFWDKVKSELGARTLTELARVSGVPLSTITSSIEAQRMPKVDRAILIARALGVSVEYLCDEVRTAV